MARTWMIGLSLACACATSSTPNRAAITSNDEQEVRCHLIDGDLDWRNAVLDETKTKGPSKVVWLNPPSASIIKTVEGYFYRCDAPL